jgi:hypothetical protein
MGYGLDGQGSILVGGKGSFSFSWVKEAGT